MESKNICRLTAFFFALIHISDGLGARRASYAIKYGRTIHEEVAGCGSLHEVGPGENFYFNSKLIRSPFANTKRKDIHYLDVSIKNQLKADATFAKLANGLQNPTERARPTLATTESAPAPVVNNYDEYDQPPSVDKQKSQDSSRSQDQNLVAPPPGRSWRQRMNKPQGQDQGDMSSPSNPMGSFSGGPRRLPEDVITTTPKPTRKPHWSDKYMGRARKDGEALGEPRVVSDLKGRKERERSGFFAGKPHTPSGAETRSKRSIFNKDRKSAKELLQRGKHETCTWRFTAKETCKHLVAKLTSYKEKEMLCEKENLHFKSQGSETRFCNGKKFSGSFHARGKILIIEHKKLSGSPGGDSNFEGYVTCLDK